MTNKEFTSNYYTHEAILHECAYNKEENYLQFVIHYCEWQLNYMDNSSKGYKLILKQVSNISSEGILNCKDIFILHVKLTKTKCLVFLDNNVYIEFNYKDIEVIDI